MSNQVFFFASQSALNEWIKSEIYQTSCRAFCEESGRTEAEFLKALKIEVPPQLSFEEYVKIFNDFRERSSEAAIRARQTPTVVTIPYPKFLEPYHDKTTLKRKKHRKNWR